MTDQTKTQPALTDRQRDYLLLTIFVFAQHGDHARAKQIVDGMLALGERSEKVFISQAVLEFFCGNHAEALRCLDHLDQVAGTGKALDQDTKRMRQYLRARCYYASGQQAEAQSIAAKLTAPTREAVRQ
ncbi:hypothetical protein [Yoonia sp. BS5-3]|uniref:Tetratricopeptide repeat protein n=1 Tax=Yoonia phaeophyticola TaxID=3137369 RepID=A0ABZ2V9G2_9RHOB